MWQSQEKGSLLAQCNWELEQEELGQGSSGCLQTRWYIWGHCLLLCSEQAGGALVFAETPSLPAVIPHLVKHQHWDTG